MDLFSKLPSLVLTNIFTHIESERGILQLIRASPVMLTHYIQYRQTIIRYRLAEIVAVDDDGTIVQDSLAIIRLPSFKMNSRISSSSKTATFRIIHSWEAKAFPNPLTQHDQEKIGRLYRFFSRVITFIEDYLAKALDPFSARAYLALPDIASVVTTMHFKGRQVDIKPVAFGAMSYSERRRLLRAFVRYELLCKVHHPQLWNGLEPNSCADIVDVSNRNSVLKDCEALYCVQEYFKGLYGAVFAHCQDSWFPDRLGCSKSGATTVNKPVERLDQGTFSCEDYGLLYPDNVYFDAQGYSRGIVYGVLRDYFPSLGLDLLSSILLSLGKDGENGQHLRRWFDIFSNQLRDYRLWTLDDSFHGLHKRLTTDERQVFYWQIHMESQYESSRNGLGFPTMSLSSIDQRVLQFHQHNLQLMIFRQRAWVFFDNTRLCSSSGPHLPAWSELDAEDQATNEMVALVHERARRRSQKWQDYWSGRSLEHPFEQQDEDDSETVGRIEDNPRRPPRFFEKPRRGEEVTCWKLRSTSSSQ